MKKYSMRFSCMAVIVFLCLSACNKIGDSPPPGPDDLPPVSDAEPFEDPTAAPPIQPEEPSPPKIDVDPPSPPPAYPSVDLAAGWPDNGLAAERTVYQNTFKKGGTTTLTANGSFPQPGATAIDAYYTRCRDDFERLCESREEEAGRDTIPYEFSADFSVECSAGGVYSVLRHIYQYTGGVHGSTDIACETFSVSSGLLLRLDDFFTVGREDYTARLLEHVYAVIDANPNEFWADAKSVARELFPYDTFCITKDGVSLFFPEYNLAPYASGAIRVDVPWGAIDDVFALPG